MKRIGVLTSGGDAPGMNPAIRAVVRTALGSGMEVFGIQKGFKGLYENEILPFTSRDVSGIINKGGTILRSIRFPEFKEKKIREKAYQNLLEKKIEGLVVIGGDGSAKGAYALFSDFHFPVVLIPASIDNDIYGTDYTVGFDTAANTAVDAIDRIRDTATSHERTFIIEVMGRESGNIAVEVSIACGAEIVIIPEKQTVWEDIFKSLEEQREKGKISSLIVLAEGAGKAPEVAEIIKKRFPEKEVRFSVLGYIQRGGKPSHFTRVLATKFGVEAVKMFKDGIYGHMVAFTNGDLAHIPLKDVVSKEKSACCELLEIVRLMAI